MEKKQENAKLELGLLSSKLKGTIKNLVCYERFGKIVIYEKNVKKIKK